MILEYATNKKSIILAISSATNDLPTSEAIKLALAQDPDGSRTLAVLTKMDEAANKDLTDELTGKIVPVKLGIIGVVNHTEEDIKKGIPFELIRANENKFFQLNYPLLAPWNGSTYLAHTLSAILKKHIEIYLPDVEVSL